MFDTLKEPGMHIALVGYRACGKTTLGRVLADRLHRFCVDVDHELERGEGRTIPEIFSQDGEERFRDLEQRYLGNFCTGPTPLVISTGGGCILRSANREMLRTYCTHVVYIEAPAALLAQRLQRNAGNRPSLSGQAVDQEVAQILEQRRPLYEQVASHIVDANMPLNALVQNILEIVEN